MFSLLADSKMLVGIKLKEYKEKMGLSSVELASRLEISEAYLSQVLSGKRVGMRKVVDFAEKLGVSVEYLTGKQVFIPIETILKAGAVVEMHEPTQKDNIEVTHLPELRFSNLENLYAMKAGDNLVPFAKKGDIFIVHRKFESISYGDRFISLEDDIRRLRYVTALVQNHLVLACILNIAPARLLDKKLASFFLHKIIYQIYA